MVVTVDVSAAAVVVVGFTDKGVVVEVESIAVESICVVVVAVVVVVALSEIVVVVVVVVVGVVVSVLRIVTVAIFINFSAPPMPANSLRFHLRFSPQRALSCRCMFYVYVSYKPSLMLHLQISSQQSHQ
jgi:hypothetical protein